MKEDKTQKKKIIEEKLQNIYKEEDGTLPDLTHIDEEKIQVSKKFIGAMLALIVIAAGAGWFFTNYGNGQGFDESNMKLAISGPEKVTIGGDVEFKIRWESAKTGIKNARLLINYPKGFIFNESSLTPSGENNNIFEWKDESQNSGGMDSGEVAIRGSLYGNQDQEQSLRVFLNYEPINFLSTFQRAGNFTVITAAAPVSISLDAAEVLVSQKESKATVEIINISEKPIEGLVLEYPKGPEIKSVWNESETKGLPKNSVIVPSDLGLVLPPLEATSTIYIPFKLTPLVDSLSTSTLKFALIKEVNKEKFVIAEYLHKIELEKNAIDFKIIANGKTDAVEIQPGETVSFTLFYENRGNKAVRDAKISIIIDSPASDGKSIFDWAQIQETQNAQIDGKNINNEMRRAELLWNSKSIPELALLRPGGKDSINFQIPVKSDQDTIEKITGYSANIKSKIGFKTATGALEEVQAGDIKITFNSDLAFEADAIKSDEENKFNVNLRIKNTWHALENVEIKTKLFGPVEWTLPQDVPAGSISYNPSAQEVIWSVPKMPPEIDILALVIPVKLTNINPTQTAITDKIMVKAMDTVSGKEINLTHEEVPVP